MSGYVHYVYVNNPWISDVHNVSIILIIQTTVLEFLKNKHYTKNQKRFVLPQRMNGKIRLLNISIWHPFSGLHDLYTNHNRVGVLVV